MEGLGQGSTQQPHLHNTATGSRTGNAHTPSMASGMRTERVVEVGRQIRRKEQQLSAILGLSVQVPRADTRKIGAMRIFWYAIAVVEDVQDVLPILHLHRACPVSNDELDGRKKVKIPLLVTVERACK